MRISTFPNQLFSSHNLSTEPGQLHPAIFSFIGGGDASIFTPSGQRGILSSSVDGAGLLSQDFLTAISFPIIFTFDLNAGTAIGIWTNPVRNQAESVTITLEFNKMANDPDLGQYYIFTGDSSTDQAGYMLTFMLLRDGAYFTFLRG